jgi:hypothetical protein
MRGRDITGHDARRLRGEIRRHAAEIRVIACARDDDR